MRKPPELFAILLVSAVLPIVARAQQAEPLGDVARQLRQEKETASRKATKVFTNDNLPAPNPMEPVSQSPPVEQPATSDRTTSPPSSSLSTEMNSSKPSVTPDGKAGARDNLHDRLEAARRDLAQAKEQEQLAEDELNLLQIQQVRELNDLVKADLTSQVEAKQSEVDIKEEATEAAQKVVDNLQNQFKNSGAPNDGGQSD